MGKQFDEPDYQGNSFPTPRGWQDEAHQKLREGAKAGHKAQVLMAPTGSGKTYLGLRIIHEALKKGRRAMFVCDRVTLIEQTSAVASRYGLSAHGIIQADHWRTDSNMPFQIASVQSLQNREWPEVDVTVIDECHTQYKAWRENATNHGMVIGLSATPFSTGLGQIFSNLVNAATMEMLVKDGVLVPMRIFSCTKIDMNDAPTAGGEWTDKGVETRGTEIIGDVVKEWKQYAQDRKTIVFGATVRHCEEMARKFNEEGIYAQCFTVRTKQAERDGILEEFRKPDSAIKVLLSVEALAKGFDVPDVGVVCDCRPLRKSLSTAIQMWGRAMRAFPGKEDCYLLDFSGNAVRFCDDYSDVYFNGLSALDAGEKLDKAIRKDEDDEDDKKAKTCPNCGYTPMGSRCVACGHEPVKLQTIEHQAGVMKEIFLKGRKMAEDRFHLYQQACTYTRSRGNPDTAPQRAAYIFKDITGEWPSRIWDFNQTPNAPITKNVMGQIKAKNIAFAKASVRRL